MTRERFTSFFLGSLLVCLLCGVSAHAQTIGVYNGGNCFPFMCNDSATSSGQTMLYQQVYTSTAFSSPTTIDSVTFYYASAFDNSSTVLNGTYDIFLSTTSALVGSLSISPASNLGTDNILVDTFSGGVSSNPSFTINFSTDFNYNPADGNLLLQVIATNQDNVPNFSTNGYNESDYTGLSSSRGWCTGSCSTLTTDNYALVTTFNTTSSPTPEPTSASLFGLGLLCFAVLRLLTPK